MNRWSTEHIWGSENTPYTTIVEPKSLQMVTPAMKRCLLLGRKATTNLDKILIKKVKSSVREGAGGEGQPARSQSEARASAPPWPSAPTRSARLSHDQGDPQNNHGKPRLSKFYQPYSEDTQQQIIRETFHLVSKRDENVCNFLEGGLLIGGSDNKLIYRHYAMLYFVFCVDSSESELGILDLIQVFVETLDKCFENVCELDLIFHVDKVHNILAEMVMGGMVLESNMNEIVTQIDAQNKLEKSEAGLAGAPARAVSAVKNMNLPENPRNSNIGDISIKVPNLPSFK